MDVAYLPKFERSARLVRNLTEASSLSSWFAQQMVDVSWIASTQRDTLVRLAHYSTRIEGNPLTLPEVEALAAGKDLAVEERTKLEVLNYFAALRWIWKSAPWLPDERSLLKLHKMLTQGILPAGEAGAYKSRPNAVFANGRVIYKPPPPEAASILTGALLDWVSSAGAAEEHAIIVAGVAHHRLVSIHPFMDGNGRIARALGSWLLYRKDFDTHHIFALDEFFEQDRNRYYAEIQKVRDNHDDLTSWLEYSSEGILQTLKKTQLRIHALRLKKPAAKIVLLPKQERILQILSQTPSAGGGGLARALNITRSHLSKLIRPLIKTGLIVKKGSTKSSHYHLP